MKQLKKYMVYVDDGRDCSRFPVPAINEKMAREEILGSGCIVAIKDVSEDYPISLDKVGDALVNAKFGKDEIFFILRTLSITGIGD